AARSRGMSISCSVSTRPGTCTVRVRWSGMAPIMPATDGGAGAGVLRSEGAEQLVELLVALDHAVLHAAGHEGVAVLEAVDQGDRDDPAAAAAEVLERGGLQRDAVREAFVGEGLHETVVRTDVVEGPEEVVLDAV